MKNKNYKSLIIKTLLIIISVLYILFIYIDIFNGKFPIPLDRIKYICIVLCFLISLLTGKDALNKRDVFLLQIGLFFTVIADFFLIILVNNTLGVVFFCFTQLFYSIRYRFGKFELVLKNSIIIFLLVLIFYLTVNHFIADMDILIGVSLYYSIFLIRNVVDSVKICKNNLYPYPNKYMIAIGMILFLLCDINVALRSISGDIYSVWNFPYLFRYTISSLVWIFYIPSQVSLSLSGYRF
ncbi:lysoplasmalogenase family protein [Anaerosalibacter massiliensis]|uniref:Lysoplasmalogenase family protein n=1 Tax=Anaerosalibacter massiliensis TaxID=1347392 RepID=A0A9X2S8N2_9FIRM|nr:lysoplasmalogenase family protein [Anaerosalibacter massiliensis]MCR2045301.1 lysoplasmalogenase family protein [Anaerosalibacter massiliensis]